MQFIHIPKNAGSSICDRFKFNMSMEEKHALADKRKGTNYFAVVRNPYDRFISMACYFDKRREHTPNTLKCWFIEQQNHPILIPNHPVITEQYKYVYRDGELIADIIRYENIEDEFKKRWDVTLPFINFSRRGDYQYYYDDELQKIVVDYYGKDFELFQYSRDL